MHKMVEVLKPKGRGGLIICCDHATNFMPDDMQDLGLTAAQKQDHIAWDPGAADVARVMSELMDVPVVFGAVSRLVVDCNREPDHETLIPVVSDGVRIEGNVGLDAGECQRRLDNYYYPFHNACEQLVADHLAEGIIPLVVGMHSFTESIQGAARPWHVGFLHKDDPRLAQAMIGVLERETDLCIGDNEPYSGHHLYYTMQRHGADHGLPQTTVEIRQDLLRKDSHIREWAALMCDVVDEILDRKDVRAIKHF